jgi:hypothetical protein
MQPDGMRPTRGVSVPMCEEVIREVMGMPVVVRYRPWGPLWAHRQWSRFGGRPYREGEGCPDGNGPCDFCDGMDTWIAAQRHDPGT